jgi:hypothetical protein
MKVKLRGQRFDTVEEIQVETQMVLNTLTRKRSKMHFKSGCDQFVYSQGDYFEGDGAE